MKFSYHQKKEKMEVLESFDFKSDNNFQLYTDLKRELSALSRRPGYAIVSDRLEQHIPS